MATAAVARGAAPSSSPPPPLSSLRSSDPVWVGVGTPEVRGTSPSVAVLAPEKAGVAGSVAVRSGSFSESVPLGLRTLKIWLVHVLSLVLHGR